MLQRVLDMPVPDGARKVTESGGFGYRRVKWGCNTLNEGSRKLAERMGFKSEGISRSSNIVEEHVAGDSGQSLFFHTLTNTDPTKLD